MSLSTLPRLAGLLCLLSVSAHAQGPRDVIYVDQNAAPGGDGTSWELAYNHLGDALDNYYLDFQIWVAEGVYRPDQGAQRTPGRKTQSACIARAARRKRAGAARWSCCPCCPNR